jgi:peptidoglycan/xylan/chitin deacetylase (PgdA/CDA1 family)
LRVPVVLLYHIIASCPEDADGEERGLFVDRRNFEQQMDDLVARGYRTLTLDQFASATHAGAAPARSLLLTFDDAYAHIDAVVSPVLRRHGFTAVMFACPAHLGGNNTWDIEHKNLAMLQIAGEEQMAAMASGPWEIASHGNRHVDLRGMDQQRRHDELVEARERLSQLVKKPVVDLAYPYGFDDPRVRADVRSAGYRVAFTMGHTTGSDPFHLPRRPIRGTDSLPVFRLKTSGWSDNLYRMGGVAPDWARSAARTVMGAGR